MFSTLDGKETIYFPLPVRVASSERLTLVWQVHGARFREPRPASVLKWNELTEQHDSEK